MTAWPLLTLGSLCSRLTSGGTPSRAKPEFYEPGEHLWVKSKELLDRSLTETEELISEAGLRGSSAKFIRPNSVLLAMYGANVGQLGWLKVPATVNQAICALETDPDVTDGRWLFYSLMHWRPALTAKAHGAAQQNLSQVLIREFAVPTPPWRVQRKIAAVLWTYDELIENNLRRIEILEHLAQAVYWKYFKAPESDDASAPWSLGTVADVLVLQRGFDLPASARIQGPIPVLGASGVQGFHNEWRAHGPGVVTGRSGTIGRVTYVDENYWPLNTVLWITEYRCSSPVHSYFFLKDLGLEQLATGAAVPTLNRNHVAQIPAQIPPIELVEEFDDIAEPMFQLMSNLRRQTANLRSTRDLLLPKLIAGDIDVSELDIDTDWLVA